MNYNNINNNNIYFIASKFLYTCKKIYINNLYKVKQYDKKCTGITYRNRLKTMQGNYYNG